MISCKERTDTRLNLSILDGLNEVVSCLRGVYTEENILIITCVFTEIAHRNKGYATALLKRAVWEAKRNGIQAIKLDDCTDNFRQPENIYLQNGFSYDTAGFPEMTLSLKPGIPGITR